MPDAPSPVEPEEAVVLLEPLFDAARDTFDEYEKREHGTRQCRKVTFRVVPWKELEREHGYTRRNFAGTSTDGRRMIFAAEVVDLPSETVAAIIAHEFGHAVDFLHPGSYAVIDDELVRYAEPNSTDPRADRTAIARMRQWNARDKDTVERTADLIAEAATGQPIAYSGELLLQTFGEGPTRPEGLR